MADSFLSDAFQVDRQIFYWKRTSVDWVIRSVSDKYSSGFDCQLSFGSLRISSLLFVFFLRIRCFFFLFFCCLLSWFSVFFSFTLYYFSTQRKFSFIVVYFYLPFWNFAVLHFCVISLCCRWLLLVSKQKLERSSRLSKRNYP